jgi:hypothetical protein
LQGHAIAVAQRQLQHRFNPCLLEQNASGETGHAHHGELVVGDVHGVAGILEKRALLEHDLGQASSWRPCFGGDGELPTCEDAFQLAT